MTRVQASALEQHAAANPKEARDDPGQQPDGYHAGHLMTSSAALATSTPENSRAMTLPPPTPNSR